MSKFPPLLEQYSFTQHAPCYSPTLVVPVNCAGKMGAGFALAIKNEFPDIAYEYEMVCDLNLLIPGSAYYMWLTTPPFEAIVFAATKNHWKRPTQLTWIRHLAEELGELVATSTAHLYIPKLGCGRGELSWDDVHPILEHYLSPYPEQYTYLEN